MKLSTLSMLTSLNCSDGWAGISVKLIHIFFVFLAFNFILFSSAHPWAASKALCKLLGSPAFTEASFVQSSAYLPVFTRGCSGTPCSRSLICMLYNVGEMPEPCGTSAAHGAINDSAPCRFTCCVLPSKKLLWYYMLI